MSDTNDKETLLEFPLVAEVLRSGYRWKGTTLRAAMVRTRD